MTGCSFVSRREFNEHKKQETLCRMAVGDYHNAAYYCEEQFVWGLDDWTVEDHCMFAKLYESECL